MQTGPTVTVITPFFNVAPYLAEAIESVLAQTFEEWELVLVDDSSTDGGRAIADGYAERHSDRITVVAHPGGANRGISASRNLGRRHARGTWLASLDGDDVWVSTKLSDQMAIAAAHPEVGLIMGASRYWSSWADGAGSAEDRIVSVGAPQDSVVPPPLLLDLLYPLGRGAAPSMNTVLVRADLVDQVGGWEDDFRTGYEDQAFLAKLYLETSTYVASACWDLYRQRPGSVSVLDLREDGYDKHRRQFLEWYETYLIRRNLTRAPVWRSLQRALRHYRHPFVARIERKARGALRRLAALAGG